MVRNNLIGPGLQVAGALALSGGVAMVSVPGGVCVLGLLAMIFGIATEKDSGKSGSGHAG